MCVRVCVECATVFTASEALWVVVSVCVCESVCRVCYSVHSQRSTVGGCECVCMCV